MAKKKTTLSDCHDATLGQVNYLRLGSQLIQFIEVKTETARPCAVCEIKADIFWTMNLPFATSTGGNLLPAFSLVCSKHSPAIQETADDYVPPAEWGSPETIHAGEWDLDEHGNIITSDPKPEQTAWPCVCNIINNIAASTCLACGADRADQPAWTCGCGVHNHFILTACKACGKKNPNERSTENNEPVSEDSPE